jgi:tetratricopeptide (TPR) repeat protein
MKARQILLPSLVTIALAALLALPSLLAGWHDLSQARTAMDPLVAARQFEQAAHRLPWRADLLEQAAFSALAAGDTLEAARLFGAARARGALSAEGHVSYGDSLWIRGKVSAALKQWQRAEAAGLQSAPLERRLAVAYIFGGDYAAAREALGRAVALDPQDADSEFRLGLLLAASVPEQSLDHFTRAVELDPKLGPRVRPLRVGINQALLRDTPAEQLTEAGRALSAAGELQLAAEALQAALELDPQAAGTWSLLGQVRESLGQDGLPEMEKALDLAPRDPQVQVMQGLFWLRRGDAKQARPYFVTAAALDPQNPVLQVAKADALARMGDLDGAYAAYQGAIALAPGQADYWRLLANFSADYVYDVPGVGLSAALQAQALEPDDYETLITLGRVAFAQGQTATAGRFFSQAFEVDPTQAAAPLYLAIVAIQQGQSEAAHQLIEHILLIDPYGAYGQRARLLLQRYFGGG